MNKPTKRLTQIDYLNIVLEGAAKHNEYLSEYFIGEFKQAEQNNIGYAEFYFRLLEANNSLVGLIDAQWMERKREIGKLRELRYEKGEPFEDLVFPEKSDFPVQAHQISKLTANKYLFFLSLSDLDWIDRAIKDSMKENVENHIHFFRYKEVSPAFNALHHTIITVCKLVKPVFDNVEPLKYFPYFFDKVDFHKLGKTQSKQEQLSYCNAIYWGLEEGLRQEINCAILAFQNSISSRTSVELATVKNKLNEIIGNLKIQTRSNTDGISFKQRYNAMYKDVLARDCLFNMDYIVLITEFQEVIANDLLSQYIIISDSISAITSIGVNSDKKQQEFIATKAKYSYAQVALLHIYRDVNILDPRTDGSRSAQKIAAEFGFNSATSGEQLYKKFRNLDGGSSQRTGVKARRKMISDIEAILNELEGAAKEKAKAEITTLSQKLEYE